jgi:hypothetical protein
MEGVGVRRRNTWNGWADEVGGRTGVSSGAQAGLAPSASEPAKLRQDNNFDN